MKTFRQRAQQQTTDALIEIGLPVIPDLAARLGDAIARGRTLAKAGRSVRSQREYERWNDAVAQWRTAIAETLIGSVPPTFALAPEVNRLMGSMFAH